MFIKQFNDTADRNENKEGFEKISRKMLERAKVGLVFHLSSMFPVYLVCICLCS